MLRRVMACALCFILLFEESGFAQAAQEVSLVAQSALSGVFNNDAMAKLPSLRYLSYDEKSNTFQIIVNKGNLVNISKPFLGAVSRSLLNYFFVGVNLPNESFWVNLKPDSESRIIDDDMARTDAGKVFLEADLQLKKDFANFTSPESPQGKEYWQELNKKIEESFGTVNLAPSPLTRVWIVPGEIIIREAGNSAYIYKATLNVLAEDDYLKWQDNVYDERLRSFNKYSSQLVKRLILPALVREVNTSKNYAALRQVYHSFILAQWFKQKFLNKKGMYPFLINKKFLSGLTSKDAWSRDYYFEKYKESYEKGEYHIRDTLYESIFGSASRVYSSGGLDFVLNIPASPGPGKSATLGPVTKIEADPDPGRRPPIGHGEIEVGIKGVSNISKGVYAVEIEPSQTSSESGFLPDGDLEHNLPLAENSEIVNEAKPKKLLSPVRVFIAIAAVAFSSLFMPIVTYAQSNIPVSDGAIGQVQQGGPNVWLLTAALTFGAIGYMAYKWFKYRNVKYDDPDYVEQQKKDELTQLFTKWEGYLSREELSESERVEILNAAEKIVSLRPFEVEFAADKFAQTVEAYGKITPLLLETIRKLKSHSQNTALDNISRQALFLHIKRLVEICKYCLEYKYALNFLANIPVVSDYSFRGNGFFSRLGTKIVGVVFGFHESFNASAIKLREQRLKLVSMGNAIGNIYPHMERNEKSWEQWLFDYHSGKRQRLTVGVLKKWKTMRGMVTRLITVGILIFITPYLVATGTMDMCNAASTAQTMDALWGLFRALLGLTPVFLSIYALNEGNKDHTYDAFKAELGNLEDELKNVDYPRFFGADTKIFNAESLRTQYLKKIASLMGELSKDDKSTDIIILASDADEKELKAIEGFFLKDKGLFVREDVPLVSISSHGRGTAAAYVQAKHYLRSLKQENLRAAVLLIDAKDIERVLEAVPLPDVKGRPFASIVNTLINCYEGNQALKNNGRQSGLSVMFAEDFYMDDIKNMLDKRITEFNLLTAQVSIDQTEKQAKMRHLIAGSNGDNGKTEHLDKIYTDVNPSTIRNRMERKGLANSFDWNNKLKPQMRVFAGGFVESFDDKKREELFASLCEKLLAYTNGNYQKLFPTDITAHLLVPLAMLYNNDENIYTFFDSRRSQYSSWDEWNFYWNWFNIIDPYFHLQDKDSGNNGHPEHTFDFGICPSYHGGSFYVKLDGTDYEAQFMKSLEAMFIEIHKKDDTKKAVVEAPAAEQDFHPVKQPSGTKKQIPVWKAALETIATVLTTTISIAIPPLFLIYACNKVDLRGADSDWFDSPAGPFSLFFKRKKPEKSGILKKPPEDRGPKEPGAREQNINMAQKELFLPASEQTCQVSRLGSDRETGGIDFSELKPSLQAPLDTLNAPFEEEIDWLRGIIDSGGTPEISVIKECLTKALAADNKRQRLIQIQICIAGILKNEEEKIMPTSIELKQLLVFIERTLTRRDL